MLKSRNSSNLGKTIMIVHSTCSTFEIRTIFDEIVHLFELYCNDSSNLGKTIY